MTPLIQRSPEWYAARVGSLGASCVHEVVAKTKTGFSASRQNRLATIVLERITGKPEETFQSAAMLHGIETEAEARAAYEFLNSASVTEVGLIRHPSIADSHASPDGLIGDDGVLELKCPQPAAHLDFLLTGKIPEKYVTQMLWQLSCTGRQWADFASYSPAFPPEMRLATKRMQRDDARIAKLEELVGEFLADVAVTVAKLRKDYIVQPGSALESLPEREKRDFSDLPAATQVVLACKNPTFREYLTIAWDADVHDEDSAQAWVVAHCCADRKRDIAAGTNAFALWSVLHASYTAWRDYERAA